MKRGILGKLSIKSNGMQTLNDFASIVAAEANSQNQPPILEQTKPQTFGMLS